MAHNNKRKTSPVQGNEQPAQETKTTPLENAKRILHEKIQQHPDKRIYQIEQIDPRDPSKTYQPFVVASPDEMCRNHILDSQTHANVREYYFGGERCPLVFDVEWYNPVPTPHDTLFDIIGHVVDALVSFLSIATERDDGVRITRDDVCVEQACSKDGRKASFHIKVPSLVFANMAYDMGSFAFYFCAWLCENHEDPDTNDKIPDIFFQQTKEAQDFIKEIIKNNQSVDPEEVAGRIRTICEEVWQRGKEFRYKSCGIDHAIYRNGSAFRIAGVCKPNKPGETPRFLRPCLVTRWWEKKLAAKYLDERILRMDVPPKEYRRAWAKASLLMVPAPTAVNIEVPPPRGVTWKKPARNSGDEYVVLPPPATDGNERKWRWVLDPERYVHPDTVKQTRAVAHSSVVPVDLDVDMEAVAMVMMGAMATRVGLYTFWRT